MTVLLVEDIPLVRIDLAEALQAEGIEVIEAGNAADAIRLLDSHPVALVCTDLQMPGALDGLALIRWIKERRPHLPIAVITGAPVSQGEASTLCDPALVFTKPFSAAVVAKSIRQALADGGS